MTQTEQTLRDKIQIGTLSEVHKVLMAMHQHFQNVCLWITSNVRRTDRTLALFNLLSATSGYLHIAAHNLQTHPSILALATRSLYELNLRTQHLLASDENFSAWQAEAALDKIELLEGILLLQTNTDLEQERAILQNEIDRLKNLSTNYGLPSLGRIPSTAQIANSVGKKDEHKALFKLFSKVVHPSSYLVNDYQNAASGEVSFILQTHTQLYAWDIFSQICTALNIPELIRVLPNEKV
ncbi:MAG: hypothetical protein Fur0044_46070 [Anaerolineae bacterium]